MSSFISHEPAPLPRAVLAIPMAASRQARSAASCDQCDAARLVVCLKDAADGQVYVILVEHVHKGGIRELNGDK